MQQVNQVVDQSVRSIASTKPSVGGRGSEKRLYRVNGEMLTVEEIFWRRMSGLFGYPFTRQYGVEPTPEWTMALGSLDPEQVGKGISAMIACGRYREMPPNPMVFRSMCLPKAEDFGLPSEDEAFAQAIGNRSEKHPAVVFTLRSMGDEAFQMRREKTDEARRLWAQHWAKTVDHVANGGELPQPEPEIEHRPAKASATAAAPHLDALKGLFS